ncbi:GP179 protein, partial [Vireo altiloquus]|nr:GP179 protein [Vireo altiloquus]
KAVEKGSRERESVCPWESQDSKSTDKAEICPWEVAEPPSQLPKAKQVPGGSSKGDKRITRQAALGSPERALDSRERESVCPWESQDSKSTDKAEICPWEVAEPQLEKGTGQGKERFPGKEVTKAVEKG